MPSKIILIFLAFLSGIDYGNCVENQQIEVKKDNDNKSKLQEKVASIFKKNCSVAGCHQGQYPKKKLNLEPDKFFNAIVDVPSLEVDSLKLVDTKNPESSYLLNKVKGETGIVGNRMPDDAPPLKEEEIEIIENWLFSLAEKTEKKEDIILPDSKKKSPKLIKQEIFPNLPLPVRG